MRFSVEDDLHSDILGEFPSREDALAEIRRRVAQPWDGPDNVAPCQRWRHCGRNYELVVYDESTSEWHELSREAVVKIDAKGVRWQSEMGRPHDRG